MQEECATLFGRIRARVDAVALAELLRKSALEAQVRESSHFAGSRYVRLDHAAANASFEFLPDEVLVRGDAPSQAALHGLAQALSRALHRGKLDYELELHAGQLLLETLAPVRVELRIEADVCGPISVGTVAVIRVVAEAAELTLDEATLLVDRAVFDGESVELALASHEAAEALVRQLDALPAGRRIRTAIKP